MPTPTEQTPASFSSNRAWTIGLLLFFAVILLANGAMIWISSSGKPSTLVSDESYELGLRYDEALDLGEKTRESGWQSDLLRCPSGGALSLCLRLQNVSGAPLESARGSIRLLRPSDPSLDRTLELKATPEAGLYEISSDLPSGLWEITIDMHRETLRARWTRQVSLPL
ncbi:MAG: FixH family protein [Bdellovibrionota bacterium]